MANKNIKGKEILEEVIIEEQEQPIVVEAAPTVKKKKTYRVVSYNPKSKILIVERNSKLYQCNHIGYDGVSNEIELDIE